jgi:hypothetical protein
MSPRAGAVILGLTAISLAAGCGARALGSQDGATGAGATGGALAISGHLRDPAGNAIVGGRVELYGDAFATRLSNFTGGFVFHVSPGSYRLAVSGECSFAPPSRSPGHVTASTIADFAATSVGCMTSAASNVNVNGELLTVATPEGYTLASVFEYEAAAYLNLVATESPEASVRRVIIDGNPAVEYAALVTNPGPQVDPRPLTALNVVTGIAAGGDDAIYFDTQLPPDATADTIERFVAAGRSFTREEIPELHAPLP